MAVMEMGWFNRNFV